MRVMVSAPAKAGSKSYRRRLRAEMERLGFSEQQIAEHVAADLAFHCAVRPRTAWRLARELTLDQAAERFNAELGDPRAPMKGSRIWEFEQWPGRGIRPSWKVLRTLGAIYGTPWNRLVDIEDIRELPDPDRKAYRTALSAAAAPSQPEAELQLPSQPPSPSAVGRSGQYGPHPEPPPLSPPPRRPKARHRPARAQPPAWARTPPSRWSWPRG